MKTSLYSHSSHSAINGNTCHRCGRFYRGIATVVGLLFFAPFLEAQSGSAAFVVTTLAGSAGNTGSTDGTGSAARFSDPVGVAVDAFGNVYVADPGSCTIRKIATGGVVTTLAGSADNAGSTDGTGSAARFFDPFGVAVDASGSVYVADTDNYTIRKITPNYPRITAYPQNQAVTTGADVQFSVTASGNPAPTYQWYFNGAAISGAISATLTLNNVQAANAGNYYVVVTNDAGSVTSNLVTLTIMPPIVIGKGLGLVGGGGAPSIWFYGALSLLVAIRRWIARGR
jgi:hypothetical protein